VLSPVKDLLLLRLNGSFPFIVEKATRLTKKKKDKIKKFTIFFLFNSLPVFKLNCVKKISDDLVNLPDYKGTLSIKKIQG
jgi:hypothetical protein